MEKSPWLTCRRAVEIVGSRSRLRRFVQDGALTRYAPHLRGGRYRIEELEHALRVDTGVDHVTPEIESCDQFWDGPIFLGSEHHLYAIEIVGACTKIGITLRPWTRLCDHERNARFHKRAVGRVVVTKPHLEAKDNERGLLNGETCEYLDRPFEDIRAAVESMAMTRAANGFRAPAPLFYLSWSDFVAEWRGVDSLANANGW